MKQLIFSILSMCCMVTSGARTYYFSDRTGDDSRTPLQAQDPATPWRSLAKLNTYFSNLSPGDSVLFNRGDVFEGQISVNRSGLPGDPVVFSAFGSGSKPVISGFSTLSDWVSLGNGVWEASFASGGVNVNMVVWNGSPQPMGRFPNISAPGKGYLAIQSHSGATQITNNQLSSGIDWTGAEAVIRKARWILERDKITQHSGSTITFLPGPSGDPIDNYGFFIQNHSKTLDQPGEWYYDNLQKKMQVFFGAASPSFYNVQASIVDSLVFIRDQNYIRFDGLAFSGSNVSAFIMKQSDNIQLVNCDILYSGTDGITASNSDHLVIENSFIVYTHNNALALNNCSNASIRNNRIENTGVFPGMGKNEGSYSAMLISFGTGNLIEYNVIDSTGYTPLTFGGDAITIKNNFINYFAFVKDDGSAIYTWNNYSTPYNNYGRRITGNIILNGIGAGEGTNDPDYSAASGIYMDDRVSNVEISGNTVANCTQSGIYIHNAHDLVIENNTLFNNKVQLEITQDNIIAGNIVKNNQVGENIFFAKEPQQLAAKFYSNANDIGSFGVFENNCYCRPMDDNFTIFAAYNQSGSITGKYFDLKSWQSAFGLDLSSHKCPVQIPYFTVHSLIGDNKYGNGNFNSGIAGLYCYSSTGTCQTSWSPSKMDSGALQFSFTRSASSGANTFSYIIIGIGTVAANKNYVLKFDVISTRAGKFSGTFLRKSLSPYNDLSERRTFELSGQRTTVEHLFTALSNENDASLVFEVDEQDDFTLWLDNIRLYEANASGTDPDDFIRLEYNPSKASKSVSLNETYIDVKGNVYSGTISLEPFSSIILIKQPDVTLPLRFVHFNGKKQNGRIDLYWVTANEVNTDHFDIERSHDGLNFAKIGRVVSPHSAQASYRYTFRDDYPLAGNNYYRIKQIDVDKKYSYSRVVQIYYPVVTRMEINRSGNKLHISIDIPQNSKNASIHLLTISGTLVKKIPLGLSHPDSITVDISSLSSGVYIIRLVSGHSVIINTPVIF